MKTHRALWLLVPLEVCQQKPVVLLNRKSSLLIRITSPDPAPLAWWENYHFANIVSDFNEWKCVEGMNLNHVINWEEEILISLLEIIQGAACSLNSSLLLDEAHDWWVCDCVCVCVHSFLLLYFIHLVFLANVKCVSRGNDRSRDAVCVPGQRDHLLHFDSCSENASGCQLMWLQSIGLQPTAEFNPLLQYFCTVFKLCRAV